MPNTLKTNSISSDSKGLYSKLQCFMMSESNVKIWHSKISWKISIAVFITILAVHASILLLTLTGYSLSSYEELRDRGLYAISPHIKSSFSGVMESPIDEDTAKRIFRSTTISGFAIYSMDLNLLSSYGETTTLNISDKKRFTQHEDYISSDGTVFETVLGPIDLKRPYYIVTKMRSMQAKHKIENYVSQSLIIMFLLSLFVTTVLMVSIGYWLLTPIIFLRDSLRKAANNPENPELKPLNSLAQDEISDAIGLAFEFINQNAENLKKIKSTAESQIHRLAYYDNLTSLPNRVLFLQTLNEQTRNMDAEDPAEFIVIALDLDHFKDINDTMGHSVGDALLRAVGKRLKTSLPSHVTIARTGEDEFAITIPLSESGSTPREIAEKVMHIIRNEPFRIFNENLQIRTSIGVAIFPRNGHTPDHVLKNADIALNRAKEEGRDRIKEYSEDFDAAIQYRFQMLRDLRSALENKEFSLNYQAQLDLSTGKIIGAEALLRWFKPIENGNSKKFIAPDEFIPIAEQSGLIIPIGEWVLYQACHDAAQWHKQGFPVKVAVNVSGAQFHQGDLCTLVTKVLQETGLKAEYLELEVTESVFMDDIEQTIDILRTLHLIGVELAIDDFGTGYSSLSYLRQFPIDRLKIDRSFITNALENKDDAAIARTIVALGHSLNLKVIAEGVETIEHEQFLIQHGCDEVQGYRYARPTSNDDFVKFMSGYSGSLADFNRKD